jgi:hypothetical protein
MGERLRLYRHLDDPQPSPSDADADAIRREIAERKVAKLETENRNLRSALKSAALVLRPYDDRKR